MSVVSMRKLLENGVHFGHQTRRWNPKMKPFIYTAKNGVHILNLALTIEHIDTSYAALRSIAERGGKVLFVGTKKVAQQVVLDEALRSGSFYVNQRWLGGILTNFRTIQKRIKRLLEIEEMEQSGQINLYPKKEIAQIRKEGARLENFLGGIKEMKKLPDAVFVVDPTEEHNAVAEARKCGIPVFGLVDTNCDPSIVDFGVPANDDGMRAVKFMVTLFADAIVEAKAGVLSVAHEVEEHEITMAEVIVNVEEQAAESERRRRAKMAERRNAQQGQRGGSGNFRDRGPRRDNDRPRFPRPENKVETPVEAKAVEPVVEVK